MARVLEGAAAGDPRAPLDGPPNHGQAEAGSPPASIVTRRRGGAQTRYRQIARWMALTDAMAVLTAFLASYFFRFPSSALPWEYALLTCVSPLLWVLIFRAHKLYSPQHLSAWEEFRRVISATGLGVVVLIMSSYWTKGELSRFWLGLGWPLSMVFLLAGRRTWRWYIARLRSRGELVFRTLIVGTNQEALLLGEVLKPEHGFLPVGYVGSDAVGGTHDLPIFEGLSELPHAVDELDAECVFVASSAVSSASMPQVLATAARAGIEVRLSANLPEILSSRVTVQPYGNVMALSLAPARLTSGQMVLKRIFDVLVSSIALIALSPVVLAIGLAVALTSRGPVFFRQERVTKDGRVFSMYKFRTMVERADEVLRQSNNDPAAPFFKLGPDDPRLTRVGRWIRRMSLDELPQLLNVLRGDMSLVGPRPLPAEQVAANLDLLEARHQVPAGVTGWWQIQGRSNVSAEEAVRMDLFYIENWSLSLDIFILLKTFGAVIVGRGAY